MMAPTNNALSLLIWPLPNAASTGANHVDALFYFLTLLCGGVAILIAVLIVVFGIRYRRQYPDQPARANVSSMKLELGWTIIPFLIFIFIFVWGARIYFQVLQPPARCLEVKVLAKQWMWKFEHGGGQREIGTLHVPVGRPIKLTIASQDVIHSFFVPAFRLHLDAIPGRFRNTWFEATETGTYDLFCSQYCGTQHSRMRGQIIVMAPDEYEQWLLTVPSGSAAAEGQKLFRQLACNACHTGDASARAPLLEGLYGNTVRLDSGETVVADENYIRESIMNPEANIVAGYRPIMPTFQGQVNEEQIMDLIQYIRSLSMGRKQIPPLFAPGAPQPQPVQDALQNSESNSNANR